MECEQAELTALIEQARAGDRDAFGLAITRTENGLRQLLSARGIRSWDREDLLSEVYFTAWCTLHKLRDPSCFKGWVWAICLGAARRFCVRQQLEAALLAFLPLEVLDVAVAPAPGGETASVSYDDLATELPPQDLLILQQHYLQKLRLREIGVLLGVGTAQVSRRLKQARERLTRALRRHGYD